MHGFVLARTPVFSPPTHPQISTRERRLVVIFNKLTMPHDGLERFDVLPLLVATDGAIAQLGVDHRRLRPNIVLAGVDGLAERQWPGRRLRLGEAIIEVAQVRGRCVMTTYDPDTQEQDLSVLRRLVEEFDGRMALDCAVIQGGRLTVGAPVALL